MASFITFVPGRTLIGLSLSLCIADMVRNGITADQISKLVVGTCAPTKWAFEAILNHYCVSCWHEFPEAARNLAMQLYQMGKIEQPCCTDGNKVPMIYSGKWVESEEDIVYGYR